MLAQVWCGLRQSPFGLVATMLCRNHNRLYLESNKNCSCHATQAADEELAGFQSSKQKRLNDIGVLVTMTVDQVQAISDAAGVVPRDLSNVLVFSRAELARMSHRVEVSCLQSPKTCLKYLDS